ncbi:MAG: AraC family transcriptional regulator [Bacteroidota bacterium]
MDNETIAVFLGAIFLIASLHGKVLAIILLLRQHQHRRATQYLALSLLTISIILLYECVYYLGIEETSPGILVMLPFYLRTAMPLGVYFFVRFLLYPDEKLGFAERLYFIPLGLEFLLELAYFPLYYYLEAEEFLHWDVQLSWIGEGLGLLLCSWLFPKAWLILRTYRNQVYDQYSSLDERGISWLRRMLMAMGGLVLIWWLTTLMDLLGWYENYGFVLMALALATLLFVLGYSMLLRADIFQSLNPVERSPKVPKQKPLSAKTDRYHEDLLRLMENQKLYQKLDLQLGDLAESLSISPGYLSQIIKEKEGQSFFEFVNLYRVEAVKGCLVDPEYRQYSIMGIALECGFKSKSTFYPLFKQYTGYTHSAYQKAFLVAQ